MWRLLNLQFPGVRQQNNSASDHAYGKSECNKISSTVTGEGSSDCWQSYFPLGGSMASDGDLEKLYDCRYRMHISRKYTMFIEHDGDETTVLRIMTLEQAHKRYGKI